MKKKRLFTRSAQASSRGASAGKRRRLSLEPLEERRLVALVSNGTGPGSLTIDVNEFGAFGRATELNVANPNIPSRNDNNGQANSIGDALYTPLDRGLQGTTFASAIAIGEIVSGAPPTNRDVLTAGFIDATIGLSGGFLGGSFLPPSADTPSDLSERNSVFYWPRKNINNALNLSQQELRESFLRFELRQTLVEQIVQGGRVGTTLVQSYTITNITGQPDPGLGRVIEFDLLRYFDGDLYFDNGANAPAGGLLDGGGHRIVDGPRGIDGVHQVNVAQDNPVGDPTIIQVQQDTPSFFPPGGINRWEVGYSAGVYQPLNFPTKRHPDPDMLLRRIVGGAPLRDDVIGPGVDLTVDNNVVNNEIDFGDDYDVAIATRNVFRLSSGQSITFTMRTVFGNPPLTTGGGGGGGAQPEGYIIGRKVLDDPTNPGALTRPLAGFIVYADLNANGKLDNLEPFDVTDAAGRFQIRTPIQPTPYPDASIVVAEQVPLGWTQTFPPFPQQRYRVEVLQPGQRVEFDVFGNELIFGNLPATSALSGFVWNDRDGDGVIDPGEEALPGAEVRIDEVVNGAIISTRTVVTGADGSYRVAGLVPNSWNGGEFGQFVVRQVSVPEGYIQTFPVNPPTYTVNLEAGEEAFNLNFGNRLLGASISGIVWNDLNGNGVIDLGEPGMPGVVVFVDTNNDRIAQLGEPSAVTDSTGRYQISGLNPSAGGDLVVVRQVRPLGMIQTFPTPDLSFGEANGGYFVVVRPGLDSPDVNFGNFNALLLSQAPSPPYQVASHVPTPGVQLGDRVGPPPLGGDVRFSMTIPVGDQPTNVVLADMDGRNGLDLVVANALDNSVSVSYNNGDGTFGPAFEFNLPAGVVPTAVAAGDFNRDGRRDIAVSDSANDQVVILVQNADGSFGPPIPDDNTNRFPAGNSPLFIVAADFDGDGRIDLAVANDEVVQTDPADPPGAPATVSVLYGQGAVGSVDFEAPVELAAPPGFGNPSKMLVADLEDANNLPDIAVVHDFGVAVFRSRPGRAWATGLNFSAGLGPTDVAAADFNGDGRLDLAVSNTGNSASVLINRGDGTFLPASNIALTAAATAIAAGDFDGDGDNDIAVAFGAEDRVRIFANNGLGAFTGASSFAVGDGPIDAVAGDLTGDGVADLVTLNAGDDTLSVLVFGASGQDGVTFLSPLIPGQTAAIIVNASTSQGFLQGWVDFNRNGTFDANERIFNNVQLAAGDNPLFFFVPPTAVPGETWARFRFSLSPNLGPGGPALSGEVEDYLVTIQPPSTTPVSGFTNPINPFDVTADGVVTLADALAVINELRASGPRVLPSPPTPQDSPPPFVDVSGDGMLTLNDALRVINFLFTQMNGAGEPEQAAPPPHDPFAVSSALALSSSQEPFAPREQDDEPLPPLDDDAAEGTVQITAGARPGVAGLLASRGASLLEPDSDEDRLDEAIDSFADEVADLWAAK